jgi:NitT/TauT family transport system substrate-binding protein
MTIEPFATDAVDEGIAVKIMGCDEFYPNQEISAIMYGPNLLRAHRDLGNRFMRAYLRGVRYYNGALAKGSLAGQNAPEVIKILSEETRLKDPAMFRKMTPSGSNPDGHVYLDSMRSDLAFFKQTGLIEGNVTADQVVDDAFASEAVKALGPYQPPSK